MKHAKLQLESRLALSVGEAAAALGVSERHLRTLLPELPHVHLGARVVVPVEALREWLRVNVRVEGERSSRVAEEILRALDGVASDDGPAPETDVGPTR